MLCIPAISHIRLEKLQSRHLEAFFRNLAEAGINSLGTYAISNKLAGIMQDRKLSRAELAKAAGIASATVSAAARGKHISLKKAAGICEGLNLPLNQVFTIYESETGLSDKTILHHHRLISAILEKAKRERIIPFNVAAEYATAPKVEHKEAQYLDDNQAREASTFVNIYSHAIKSAREAASDTLENVLLPAKK